MQFVLDCSVAISWCMADEDNPYANAIWAFMSENEAIIPGVFWLEIVNVLLVAERRGRISQANTTEALTRLRALRIVVDTDSSQQSLDATLELSRQYNLAAYDAAYLELAIREELLLATIDNRLAQAARQCNVWLENPTIET